jgi:hypothetical protein
LDDIQVVGLIGKNGNADIYIYILRNGCLASPIAFGRARATPRGLGEHLVSHDSIKQCF